MTSLIGVARAGFHNRLVADGTLSIAGGIASNADQSQNTSRQIALHIASRLNAREMARKLDGQRAGKQFEDDVAFFLRETFPKLSQLRPGKWTVENMGSSRGSYQIAEYVPYTHLADLARAISGDPNLRSALGNSYEISPDILVLREPEDEQSINQDSAVVDSEVATATAIRLSNQSRPIVHAVVSCKWTLRSDRAQNARSEALNIIRNRKGRAPHIAVVTAEPTPSRISSLALGTGDLDCVYHFALPELVEAVTQTGNNEAINTLFQLREGDRLRDISDLPLDLTI